MLFKRDQSNVPVTENHDVAGIGATHSTVMSPAVDHNGNEVIGACGISTAAGVALPTSASAAAAEVATVGVMSLCVSRSTATDALLWQALDLVAAAKAKAKGVKWLQRPSSYFLNSSSVNSNAVSEMSVSNPNATTMKSVVDDASDGDGGAAVHPPFVSLVCEMIAERDATDTPILLKLATDYPAQVRSLRALTVVANERDESADLGAFAALATQLRTLTFQWCGLTSMQGLLATVDAEARVPRCQYLRKVCAECCTHLESLDGLQHHTSLEELDVAGTPVHSLEPLRTCPVLTNVIVRECRALTDLSGLEEHAFLEVVDATSTNITDIDALLTCPALAKVSLWNCSRLSSLAGLAHHTRLREVEISGTPVTSLEALRSCPALISIDISGCKALASLGGLEHHAFLKEVNATSATAITALLPLLSCPALTRANVQGCQSLTNISGIEQHAFLVEFYAPESAITAVGELQTCPLLQRVALDGCPQLRSLSGLENHAYLAEIDVSSTPITSASELLSCPALKRVDLRWCPGLRANGGVLDFPPGVRLFR